MTATNRRNPDQISIEAALSYSKTTNPAPLAVGEVNNSASNETNKTHTTMDKLFYIVCEEKGETLFEGRFQGRTRGAALKFLKEQIGRQSLNGTVFTITEIPVAVIREIVHEILSGKVPEHRTPVVQPAPKPEPTPAPAPEPEPEPEPTATTDWKAVKRFYESCRSPKLTAEHFEISINTLKSRIQRNHWN